MDDTSLLKKLEDAKARGLVVSEGELRHRLSEVVAVSRSDDEDYALVVAVRRGDDDAFRRLQDEYWQFVARICNRYLPEQERREIASKTGTYELEDLVVKVFTTGIPQFTIFKHQI